MTILLLRCLVASVNAIAIRITIEIPVTPIILVNRSLYVGIMLLKSEAMEANCSGDELTVRGKSHIK